MKSPVIELKDVIKEYGKIKAVNNVSLQVYQGEIFGLLGPNGAGKTTTIEMIEGLRSPDSGDITVLGENPAKGGEDFRKMIGVQLQDTAVFPKARVVEVFSLFSSFYDDSESPSKMLEKMGLSERAHSYYKDLSGGEKQKVAVGIAVISHPDILFLDELTTGLDPRSRRDMWDLIQGFREEGKTIFLTTHYMDEAEFLCDRVGIIDRGKIIALDSPQALIESINAENAISFVAQDMDTREMESIEGVSKIEKIKGRYIVYGKNTNSIMKSLTSLADKKGIQLKNLQIKEPNLDDVFIALTGRELE
ncbi:MAG: ABC transporter ATP-binding protein [Theionarchaea archaeon]|nr:ABC transporter ATP-binding protein [Theionarchaea archaeon]